MLEDLFLYHPMTVLVGTVILAVALVFGVSVVTAYLAQEHTCAKKATMLDTEYQYGFWQGGWVKQNNTWVDYNTIRNVGVK